MLLYVIKVLLSAMIIVAVSEVSKSNATLGALIKSLPLISVLSMIWVYVDTKNIQIISTLSTSTFWLVLPTLPMFLLLPYLLKLKIGFYPALSIALGCMLVLYLITALILKRFGFEL
ncbi:MAG: DUF3147 family protein [Gammaproteobacteria bacterium]|nr:DUF3147 family protein [Gammaproteobacteria bacterium]